MTRLSFCHGVYSMSLLVAGAKLNVFDDSLVGLAWAAGFADGDGCIFIANQSYKSRQSDGFRLRFCMTQNNREVLEAFQTFVGVPSSIQKLSRALASNRQCYSLVYDGTNAYNAIMMLKPFLIRKKPEADAVAQLWKECRMGKRPGRKGHPPAVIAARTRWQSKLQRLK